MLLSLIIFQVEIFSQRLQVEALQELMGCSLEIISAKMKQKLQVCQALIWHGFQVLPLIITRQLIDFLEPLFLMLCPIHQHLQKLPIIGQILPMVILIMI